jgi:TRAP transporter 4TM/12TM fusion protein
VTPAAQTIVDPESVPEIVADTPRRRFVAKLVTVVAAAMSLYHIYVTAFAPPQAQIFRASHLLFAITLVFLIYPTKKSRGAGNPSLLDIGLLVLAVAFNAYVLIFYDYLIDRIPYIDDPTPTDIAFALTATLLTLEGTRRVIGLALPLTAIAFLAWCLLFTNTSLSGLLDQLYLTTEGIYGSTLGVSAGFVVMFVLFGAFMERTGTGQLFMDFALAITGRSAGGPGKVSVVSSSLFGTISGSAVANVMVDGPITIPLMKRTGFKPHFAAGVEAVASTGGQIMPPVMGAAAFVMAEYLGVSYFQVALWALLPALLYYIACFGAVHFEAKRQGIKGAPENEIPKLWDVMRERGHLFIPVVAIFVLMFVYSAPLAALIGTLLCFPVAMMRKSTRQGLRLIYVWDALVEGGRNALSVAMACACAGIVIGVIALTGAGITFTQMLLGVAQNSLLIALLVTAAAGIVLGMGMPTTPAYIVMVSLLVPALIKLGVVEPAAHMFAFYFAILSAITPPVALAVFAAASLAKADLWPAGWAAVKIGAAGFIVPFILVYDPALMMIGTWGEVLHVSITATVGCLLLAAGLHGWLLIRTHVWEQALLLAAALTLVAPGWITDLVGTGLAAIVIASQLLRRSKATITPASS